MKSIICKLYKGQLSEFECIGFNKEEWKERNAIEKHEAQYVTLQKSFTEEQKKLFSEWEQNENKIWDKEMEAAYERGFKIGARFIIDVFNINFEE